MLSVRSVYCMFTNTGSRCQLWCPGVMLFPNVRVTSKTVPNATLRQCVLIFALQLGVPVPIGKPSLTWYTRCLINHIASAFYSQWYYLSLSSYCFFLDRFLNKAAIPAVREEIKHETGTSKKWAVSSAYIGLYPLVCKCLCHNKALSQATIRKW